MRHGATPRHSSLRTMLAHLGTALARSPPEPAASYPLASHQSSHLGAARPTRRRRGGGEPHHRAVQRPEPRPRRAQDLAGAPVTPPVRAHVRLFGAEAVAGLPWRRPLIGETRM